MSRLPAWMPWTVLALGAGLLAWQYPDLPEEWIVHYNGAGVPDGWVAKSPGSVFFPLLLGALLCAILELLARFVPVRPPFPLEQEWRVRMQRWQQASLRAISLGVALAMVALAWLIPRVHTPLLILVVLAFLVALALLAPALGFRHLVLEMEEAGVLPAGYRGLTYRNAGDPRWFVPRLTGGGTTLNLAHWQAWVLLALFVSLPLLWLLLVGVFF